MKTAIFGKPETGGVSALWRVLEEKKRQHMTYGCQSIAALADYAPISYAQHIRDYRRACRGRGRWHDDVAVDDYGDGTVEVLPSDALPYPWRQIWRKKEA